MTPTSKLAARFLTVLFFTGASLPLAAQAPFSGTPEVEQSLRRLNELGRVLMIAAHPDDERTAVLAYFARGRHMRTAYLSLTRGEGGQNLIGSEQGAQLGIIRTQELLDARRIDGAEQFFTRAIDFGFTKTASETMQKWGHDRILSDVVWVIRELPAGRRDSVLQRARRATATGSTRRRRFWARKRSRRRATRSDFRSSCSTCSRGRPRRLVHAGGFLRRTRRRAAGPGSAQEAPARRKPGQFNPILGYSYEEIAVLSRSMHHSQGTGAMRRPGAGRATPFELVEGDPASNDLFDGIDTSWASRFPKAAPR